jgi:hypothetical protein
VKLIIILCGLLYASSGFSFQIIFSDVAEYRKKMSFDARQLEGHSLIVMGASSRRNPDPLQLCYESGRLVFVFTELEADVDNLEFERALTGSDLILAAKTTIQTDVDKLDQYCGASASSDEARKKLNIDAIYVFADDIRRRAREIQGLDPSR